MEGGDGGEDEGGDQTWAPQPALFATKEADGDEDVVEDA